MLKRLCFSLLFLPLFVQATDLKPWFPRYLEIQSRFTYLHQQYCKVDVDGDTFHKRSKDDFYTGSLELAYDKYCGELEMTFSGTGRHHLGPDSLVGTFRYQLMDDITGDAASIVAGVSVSQVFSLSLKDISTFHHGGIEGEFSVAVGREFTCRDTWSARAWAVAGVGVGDHGSPWLHGILALEKNFGLGNRFRVYAETLDGLGGKDLDISKDFGGYGSVCHQSIDIGVLYRYGFGCDSSLSVGYETRVLANNCPKQVQVLYFRYLYPFGL